MDDFVRRTLGRLEEYDQQHEFDLVKTLGQILKPDVIIDLPSFLFTVELFCFAKSVLKIY